MALRLEYSCSVPILQIYESAASGRDWIGQSAPRIAIQNCTSQQDWLGCDDCLGIVGNSQHATVTVRRSKRPGVLLLCHPPFLLPTHREAGIHVLSGQTMTTNRQTDAFPVLCDRDNTYDCLNRGGPIPGQWLLFSYENRTLCRWPWHFNSAELPSFHQQASNNVAALTRPVQRLEGHIKT